MAVSPLELVTLAPLMARTRGRQEIVIALIDGPVSLTHPDLEVGNIREVPGTRGGACSSANSVACRHGTFVAGLFSAKRTAATPGICPGCTVLLRPIFIEHAAGDDQMPSAAPEELAAAILEVVAAGARIVNLSAAVSNTLCTGQRDLNSALDFAAARGVIVVAAAGNQGMVGSSEITRHPWVIPVAACDLRGRPAIDTNLGGSIGRHGLSAPGEGVASLGATGPPLRLGGTSAAAPFVTAAVALVWSEFPGASASQVKWAITGAGTSQRKTVVPPLLNAWAAYQAMLRNN